MANLESEGKQKTVIVEWKPKINEFTVSSYIFSTITQYIQRQMIFKNIQYGNRAN